MSPWSIDGEKVAAQVCERALRHAGLIAAREIADDGTARVQPAYEVGGTGVRTIMFEIGVREKARSPEFFEMLPGELHLRIGGIQTERLEKIKNGVAHMPLFEGFEGL